MPPYEKHLGGYYGYAHQATGANNLWLFKITVIKVQEEKNGHTAECFNNESNCWKLLTAIVLCIPSSTTLAENMTFEM